MAPACDKGDGDSDSSSQESSTDESSTETTTTGGDDGGFWAVGGGSEMLRVSDATILDGYDLGLAAAPDLNGIACRGTDEAWVVGDGGVVLLTDDGGNHWVTTYAPNEQDLYGVAVALNEVAWAAGDNTILRSVDDGLTWVEHPSASAAPYRSISAGENGEIAFATDTQGGLWRFTPEADELLMRHVAGLNDVMVSVHGEHVLAVGERGAAWVSHDAGDSFSNVDLGAGLNVDLHAGVVSSDGQRLVIVGDAGMVFIVDGDTLDVQQPADATTDLFDVHATEQGIQIVGSDGLVLLSEDAGTTWVAMSSDSGKALYGIDSISGGGHH